MRFAKLQGLAKHLEKTRLYRQDTDSWPTDKICVRTKKNSMSRSLQLLISTISIFLDGS